MSKQWTFVGTNELGYGEEVSRESRLKKERKFANAIRNTKVMTEERLKKDGDEAFDAETKRKAALTAAYDEKRLKSKDAIKEARALKQKGKKAGSRSKAPVTQS